MGKAHGDLPTGPAANNFLDFLPDFADMRALPGSCALTRWAWRSGIPLVRVLRYDEDIMKKCIVPVVLFALVTGCSRFPDKVYHPKIMFKAEIRDNDVYYSVFVKGILFNDNSEAVFRNVKGELTLTGPGVQLPIPFEIPVLLPFQKYNLTLEKSGKEREMKPVLDLFRIDIDRLITAGDLNSSDEIELAGDRFSFSVLSFDRDNILDIIQGKKDENQ